MAKAKEKNKGGRPLIYTAKEFRAVIVKYLKTVKRGKMPTKAGVLHALKISRETWREYKLRPEFVDTIRDVEYTIEDAWVQRLSNPGATGPIFYLKNAFKEEYKDRQETDITSGGEPLKIGFDSSFDASTRKTERGRK